MLIWTHWAFALEQNTEERSELCSYRWAFWSLSQWKCSHSLEKSMKPYYCSIIKMDIRASSKIFQAVIWIFSLSFSSSLLVAMNHFLFQFLSMWRIIQIPAWNFESKRQSNYVCKKESTKDLKLMDSKHSNSSFWDVNSHMKQNFSAVNWKNNRAILFHFNIRLNLSIHQLLLLNK